MPLPTDLETPALLVDERRLEANLASMATSAAARGMALRPHAKTHKCLEIAHRQLALGAAGLTVATVGEAEIFADAGVDDLFVAYPVWPGGRRSTRLAALAERVRLRVGVDSTAGARALAESAGRSGGGFELLVEVDSGQHRTGVPPPEAGALAALATDLGLRVAGVFTFPGHAYAPDAPVAAAAQEEAALAQAAVSLAEAGLPCPVRSGGSTPTAARSRAGTLSELRPGVYVFNDAQQVRLGTCTPDQVALAVAATVVSARRDRFVLDAGSKVLGADRPPWMLGHGLVLGVPGAVVSDLSEHHGVVALGPGAEAAAPVVGSTVAVVPNHVCTAVNLVDELVVVDDGEVVDRWRVAARGANH